MPDSPITSDPAPAVFGRTPDQLAVDRADFVRMGGSGEAFDRAIGAKPAASGPSGPSETPAKPTPPALDISARHAEIRAQNAREFVQAFRQAHRNDPPDQALALALKTGGYSEAEIATLTAGAPADIRSADERLASKAGLDAAASPDAYGPISYPQEWTRTLAPGDLQAIDTEIKDAMHQMGVPALQGPSLASSVVEAGQTYQALPEAQRRAYRAQQDTLLLNAYGSKETAQEAVALAAALLKTAPTAFLERVAASGALRSATVIAQLAHLADTANLRAELKAGRTFADVWRDNRQ